MLCLQNLLFPLYFSLKFHNGFALCYEKVHNVHSLLKRTAYVSAQVNHKLFGSLRFQRSNGFAHFIGASRCELREIYVSRIA